MRLGLYIFGAVVACYIAIKLLTFLISLLVPLAIVAAIGVVLYVIISRKALGGGRRILP